MNNYEEIQTAIDALDASMSDRGLPVPVAKLSISAHSRPYIYLSWHKVRVNGKTSEIIHGDTPEEAFKRADEWVESIPSQGEVHATEFSRKVADAIDYGHDNGIDEEYIEPLRASRKAMTENLLTVKS